MGFTTGCPLWRNRGTQFRQWHKPKSKQEGWRFSSPHRLVNGIRSVEYWSAVDGAAVRPGLCAHALRCAFDSTTHNNCWGRYPCVLNVPVGDHVAVVPVIPEVYERISGRLHNWQVVVCMKCRSYNRDESMLMLL